jgi:hypothetical protein
LIAVQRAQHRQGLPRQPSCWAATSGHGEPQAEVTVSSGSRWRTCQARPVCDGSMRIAYPTPTGMDR